jgi:hypothetical protein
MLSGGRLPSRKGRGHIGNNCFIGSEVIVDPKPKSATAAWSLPIVCQSVRTVIHSNEPLGRVEVTSDDVLLHIEANLVEPS